MDEKQEDRTCNKCGETKLISEFPKQKGCRGGYRSTCKACMAKKTKQWREADPERAKSSVMAVKERDPERWAMLDRARSAAYRERNPEKRRESLSRYVRDNPEKSREWYQSNAEHVKARVKVWAQSNPERVRLNALVSANNRRARKVKATPGWFDPDKVRAIYEERERIQMETGVPHHVDHIVPLHSPLVCGLHVQHNLRVIPAKENWSKSNKLVEVEL